MRKINHINLSNVLLEQLNEEQYKRKSFIVGNILPDCLPTFIYIRHNIESTFEKVEKLLKQLLTLKLDTYRFWIKLGCVMHYIADYFTYPHTKFFKGSFKEHNTYEKLLKNNFKKNLSKIHCGKIPIFKTEYELLKYIKEEQTIYFLEKKENLVNTFLIDTDYIFHVCQTIFFNILNIKKCANL